MVSFQPPFRISFCYFRLRPLRSQFRKWAFPRQFTKSLRSKGIMVINHERNPRKSARGWGCSSVVERVLSMYEVPGSIPGTSTSFEGGCICDQTAFPFVSPFKTGYLLSFSFLSVLPLWHPISAPRVLPPPGMSKRFLKIIGLISLESKLKAEKRSTRDSYFHCFS